MGLGRFAGEALSEVAFFSVIKKAWDWAMRMVTDDVRTTVGNEIKDRIVGTRLWKDEHFFALDLAEANITIEQKRLIEEAMEIARLEDCANGTVYARNFRLIIVARDQENPTTAGTPAVPDKPGTPEVPATKTTPKKDAVAAVPGKLAVPAGKRPGIIILEDMVKDCTKVREVYARIVAAGLLQDGHSNFEKFIDVSKKVVIPFLLTKGTAAYASADAMMTKVENGIRKKSCEYNNRSWLAKLFLN